MQPEVPLAQPTLFHPLCSLAPLNRGHAVGLAAVAEALGHNAYLHIPAPAQIGAYIDRAVLGHAQANQLAYAVVSAQGGVLGTTRFQFIQNQNHRAEIGSTWLAPHAQGTAVNSVCRLLMLAHGFERMGLQRISFMVHPSNHRNRAALASMGIQFEGVLRAYQSLHGAQADMCVYSVIASDWASIRTRIEARIASKQQQNTAKSNNLDPLLCA